VKKGWYEGLSHKVVPDAVLNKKSELSPAHHCGCSGGPGTDVHRMLCHQCGRSSALAAAMGKYSWKDAGKAAEKGAILTRAISGAKEKARGVARLAVRIMKDLEV